MAVELTGSGSRDTIYFQPVVLFKIFVEQNEMRVPLPKLV
jgi:hypothetical protein